MFALWRFIPHFNLSPACSLCLQYWGGHILLFCNCLFVLLIMNILKPVSRCFSSFSEIFHLPRFFVPISRCTDWFFWAVPKMVMIMTAPPRTWLINRGFQAFNDQWVDVQNIYILYPTGPSSSHFGTILDHKQGILMASAQMMNFAPGQQLGPDSPYPYFQWSSCSKDIYRHSILVNLYRATKLEVFKSRNVVPLQVLFGQYWLSVHGLW